MFNHLSNVVAYSTLLPSNVLKCVQICAMALVFTSVIGCASSHKTASGTYIEKKFGAILPTSSSGDGSVVLLKEPMKQVDRITKSTDLQIQDRFYSPSVFTVSRASRHRRHSPSPVPMKSSCIEVESATSICAVPYDQGHCDNANRVAGSLSDATVFAPICFHACEPNFLSNHHGLTCPVAIEQPRRPLYRRLMNPFSSESPVADTQNDDTVGMEDVFESLNSEAGGADSRFGSPGGPGDGPGGPDGGPPPGMGGPGGPGGGEPGFGVMWYPSATVSGQGTELGILRSRAGIDVPVWFKGADMVMMSVGVNQTHFSGDAILPETLRAFPEDLWNVQVGLKHMRQMENGWTSMLMFDVGSASDKPFNSTREIGFQIGGFLMIPAKNERDMWTVGAMYSPLGSPNFPIPLLSYNWKPSDTFQMSIGLPCNLQWKPIDRLTIDVSWFPIMSVNALATYEVTDKLNIYGGYQNVSDSYFLADRVNRDDQFVANEQQLIIGLRRDLTEKLSFDINAGYAFSRYFGIGDGMGNAKSDLTDLVELESGAFLAAKLTWNF